MPRHAAIHSPFEGPDLMIIGDSLAQGCRSLSVTREYCGESYPAVMAQLASFNTNLADPRQPVLFDLEAIAGDVIFQGVPTVLGGIQSNYAAWLKGFAAGKTNSVSGAEFFDNLAVTGFALEDTLGEDIQRAGKYPTFGTPALAEKTLQKFPKLDLLRHAAQIGSLHLAVNARFVLNPANKAKYQNWNQVRWVLERQPRNLIVHIGHNNGLYGIGAGGDLEEWFANWAGGVDAPAMTRYEKLIAQLAAGLPRTKIIFVGLPKVGAVANLMPLSEQRLAADPTYFRDYETVFPLPKVMHGDDVRAADESICAVNTMIAQKVAAADAGAGRLSCFSAYEFFANYDTKNLGTPPLKVGRTEIANTYLQGHFRRRPGRPGSPPRFEWDYASGGLLSIDGMHPTSIGYSVLAFDLVEKLTGRKVSTAARNRQLKIALRGERLINRYPQGLHGLRDLIRLFGDRRQNQEDQALATAMVTTGTGF